MIVLTYQSMPQKSPALRTLIDLFFVTFFPSDTPYSTFWFKKTDLKREDWVHEVFAPRVLEYRFLVTQWCEGNWDCCLHLFNFFLVKALLPQQKIAFTKHCELLVLLGKPLLMFWFTTRLVLNRMNGQKEIVHKTHLPCLLQHKHTQTHTHTVIKKSEKNDTM